MLGKCAKFRVGHLESVGQLVFEEEVKEADFPTPPTAHPPTRESPTPRYQKEIRSRFLKTYTNIKTDNAALLNTLEGPEVLFAPDKSKQNQDSDYLTTRLDFKTRRKERSQRHTQILLGHQPYKTNPSLNSQIRKENANHIM
ncbi:hypothetical protein NPIL_451671 [Nephila pilipes]|uniref:Uncharacterized protein n=1 Tax=Nephila pilipes TaxID=299642 RepID=A0A8X6NAR2_NEPPI|nr:hypothetical protein NPIL_451671 [Nephila pilipes]